MPKTNRRPAKCSPLLILHGGAGQIMPQGKKKRIQKKLRSILDAAYERLISSTALEAVTYAVFLLENDPAFNAGTGAALQRDGRSRLSASVMNGSNLLFSGVVNLENFKNPVLIARKLQNESARVLSDKGAALFASRSGFKSRDTRTRAAINDWKKKKKVGCDTVGACALDASGHLAGATSTGGRGMEHIGRVSDSCMPAGNYATAECAVSATGYGEHIMSEALSVRIVQRVADGMHLEQALVKTFIEVKARGGLMGAIAVDKRGRVSTGCTTDSLAFAWRKGCRRKFFR